MKLSDDAIEAILTVLFEPLTRCTNAITVGHPQDEKATDFKRVVSAYFSVMLIDRQFNSVMKERKMDYDWFKCLEISVPRYSKFLRYLSPLQEDKDTTTMLKTLVRLDSSLPITREEIGCFMSKHNLQYRTRRTNKIYKGFVGVRKLATMKIEPKPLQIQFKALTKKHQTIHKKRLSLIKALEVHGRKIEEAKGPRPIPNMWQFLLDRTT